MKNALGSYEQNAFLVTFILANFVWKKLFIVYLFLFS